MDNKSTLWVFIPTKEWDLGLSELVVYSYLAYRDRYNSMPQKTQVVKSCGLSLGIMQKVLDRLESKGLLLEDKVQPPPDGWLVKKDSKKDHFSQNLAGWLCYVRAHNSTLTFTEVCVWSYIRHCVRTKFTPPSGWTYSFIAHSLAIGRETAKKCLDSLDGRLLGLQSTNPLRIGLYKAVPESMMSAFRDKGEFNPAKEGEAFELETPHIQFNGVKEGIKIDPTFGSPPNGIDTQDRYDIWCKVKGIQKFLVENAMLENADSFKLALQLCETSDSKELIKAAIEEGRWTNNPNESILSILRQKEKDSTIHT